MPIELTVKKMGDTLVPAEQVDKEVLSTIKSGRAFKVSAVRVSERAANNHKLYWGGLIRLVAEYWEPQSGLISKYDKQVMGGLIDWVSAQGKNTDALSTLINLYLTDRAQRIKDKLPEDERAADQLKIIHEWLKEEAGFYDVQLTPTGIRKQVKSISFNAMPREEEFMAFYRRVFSVAWRYVFSKANFESEEQAMNLALEMSQMGR